MKVWQLDESGVVAGEMHEPAPGAGELLVRVYAAGVTPAELGWYPTTHEKTGAARKRAVPGHEFSGVVAAIGAGAAGVTAGQEVFGMNDWFWNGAAAEFCLTRPEWIAAKPKRLTHAEAASAPISALTAWQGLVDKAKLQAGERVLIHGGSGGVGTFAVQLARRIGAKVTTTASAKNADFLRGLGAEQVIDYHGERFEDQVKDVDVVFDTVGGATLARSWGVLSAKGRVVTVASNNETAGDERAKKAFFIVEPRGKELAMIAALLEAGEIKTVVDAVVPFGEADRAYGGQKMGMGRGKMVIEVST